ncbi:uncharacterized protein LOC129609428 isoform X2 [Condylostylus longicornis]|uniref:uncharacterized protein LOC129609428 isoform X2 n=1 Tax=Condylostylus longicornis TaxID=2530218 RepID=UPI00244E0CE0|nr:uncharacterized protein LOC129609428 isoform X2 [Condylostylus longicornis]
MKSTFVIFILINLFLLTFTKSIAEEDDNAKYCKVKEHRNVKVKAGEHLVLPEKCQIIKCDEQGEKYTIEKSFPNCIDLLSEHEITQLPDFSYEKVQFPIPELKDNPERRYHAPTLPIASYKKDI